MNYFIIKSGMQNFDLSRAYGLGLLLHILTNSKSMVKDFGHYFLIENNGKVSMKKIKNLNSFLSKDLPWWGPIGTNIGDIPKKQKMTKKFFKNKKESDHILNKYNSLSEQLSNKEKFTETLYGSMEPAAFKGERKKRKLDKYNEGVPFKISKYDFVLSLLGHLNFTIWKFDRKQKLTLSIQLLPDSDGINIGGGGDIKSLIQIVSNAVRIHRNGTLPTLSNVAVVLGKQLYEMKYEERIFTPTFSSLIFSVMSGGGPTSKPKPSSGGLYPLDFLYKLIESTEKSGKIFDLWTEIFRLTNNNSGYEDLALYLSEFITYPSKETLDRYLRSHLRIYLSKDIKPRLYENEIMQEVMKNV